MIEDEKPDDRVYAEHWAQPYDSQATVPGAIERMFHCWAEFAIGRAERTFTNGGEACRWMTSASNRGAARVGYESERKGI